ncbi:MAG: aminoglycoside phosphotransferase family protein [Solirubrobacterales bacterium]|nr:aminoglycoside phosphotransferase family protein [Solirubrobacterales bacterium]
MTIDEALAGEAGLAGIQWVLYGAPVQRALREAITALLEPPAILHDWRLLRAKAKPGRKLTAYYALTLSGVTGSVAPTRAIAVTWRLPSRAEALTVSSPTAVVTPMEAEAVASGVAVPFRRLLTTDAAWRMQIEVAPLDPTFPSLVRAMTPDHVATLLAPHTPASLEQVTTIRYRPRQRHVLRYDLRVPPSGQPEARPFFAKLSQADEGAATCAVVAWCAEQLTRCGCDVAALQPQAWIPDDQLLLYPHAPGVPLSQLLATDQPVLHLLHQAGIALRALHDAPCPPTLPLARKDFTGEGKATLQAGEHLAVLAPALYRTLYTLLEQVQERYQRYAAVEPSFTHSDFKADHLLVDREQLTLIDFDSCVLTDPAADVGKFLADLRWWHALDSRFALPQAQAAFLAGYGVATSSNELARARLYESLVLAKSTVRRLHLFDDQWLAQSQRLLAQAVQLLQQC